MRRRPSRRLPQHTGHRDRAEMQAGPAEHLGNLDLAHRWAQHLEPLHEIAHEVWELVHRLGDLNQGVLTLLINSP